MQKRSCAPNQCGQWKTIFLLILGLGAAFATGPTPAVADDPEGNPPEILWFGAANPFGDYWIFEGEVADEYPEGCVIVFGYFLEGEWASVNSDGSFYLVLQIPPGQGGLVSAQAMDHTGQWSDVAYDSVDNW